MRLMSLGSGSKGNATLVASAGTCVMIDCGFSAGEVKRRMANQGFDPQQLSAIFVTHEHSDHMRGVFSLAKQYSLPVYLTAGTAKSVSLNKGVTCRVIDPHKKFYVEDLEVSPVTVPHDAREPVQFVIRCQNQSVGVLTDLGSITPHVVESYRSCDGILLEANHDRDMLENGPYPYPLKQRVGGDWGHLNNGQAAELILRMEQSRLQHLVIGHISENNNNLDVVKQCIEPLAGNGVQVHYARQAGGMGWLAVV
jgi:phosphoribosyl 1,2-cyclic phosphodiesterase